MKPQNDLTPPVDQTRLLLSGLQMESFDNEMIHLYIKHQYDQYDDEYKSFIDCSLGILQIVYINKLSHQAKTTSEI